LIDDKGYNISFKIRYEDYKKIYSKILYDLSSKNYLSSDVLDIYIHGYLKACLLTYDWPNSNLPTEGKSLRKLLIFFNASAMMYKQTTIKSNALILIEKRPWMNILTDYGDQIGIQISYINHFRLLNIFKKNNDLIRNILSKIKIYFISSKKIITHAKMLSNKFVGPKIVSDQVMQLFPASSFWGISNISSDDIVFTSKNHAAIDQNELNDILNSGMRFISLSKRLSDDLDVPFFQTSNFTSFESGAKIVDFKTSDEEKIIYYYSRLYRNIKKLWIEFFEYTGAKIYVCHHKSISSIIPAFSAINEIGGISALWQMSYYEFPNPRESIFSDIYFPFSPKVAECEIQNGSVIKYLISIGFVLDFRFEMLKAPAKAMRGN